MQRPNRKVLIDGKPQIWIGVNFWSRTGGPLMWRNYDPRVVHEVRTVTDELAYRTKQDLAKREGLLAGISSGANMAVALEVARELGEGKNVVTLLCDTGERYFSLDEYFKS